MSEDQPPPQSPDDPGFVPPPPPPPPGPSGPGGPGAPGGAGFGGYVPPPAGGPGTGGYDPGSATAGYGAPAYGYPAGAPFPGQKSKIVAGILGILLGGFGIHRFYLGFTAIGIIQIVVTILTCGVGAIWGLIEGILILVGSTITTDAQGRPLSDN